MVAISFPMQIAGAVAGLAWVGYAAMFKPLTLSVFSAGFGLCLYKFGLALFGPSLLLLLPALWYVSLKIAKFINAKVDAVCEGAQRLVHAAADTTVAAATSAGRYVANRPLAALLCAAFWYALPCNKCAWYTLILGPVSHRVCVKVAERVGRLREPAKAFVGNVCVVAADNSRAAIANVRAAFGLVPDAGVGALLAPSAASRFYSKVRSAASAVRHRASHLTLREVHAAYASFAYAFGPAYFYLVVYEFVKICSKLDTCDFLDPSFRKELLDFYMWPHVLLLLKNPTNAMIVAGLTVVNWGVPVFWQSEACDGTCHSSSSRVRRGVVSRRC